MQRCSHHNYTNLKNRERSMSLTGETNNRILYVKLFTDKKLFAADIKKNVLQEKGNIVCTVGPCSIKQRITNCSFSSIIN